MRGIHLWLLAALSASCVGKVYEAGPPPPNPTPGTFDPSFSCTPPAAISATPIRRLAKVHYVNCLQEFLSPMTATDRAALMSAIQVQINLIPDDASTLFTRNDTSLTQLHAGGVFDLAFALASQVAASSLYANELSNVCGAGSTQASLTGTCAQTFVAYYGQKAFRRPLTGAEVAALMVDPSSTATPPANLNLTTANGLTSLLVRLLAHPRFFYRLDDEGALTSGTDGASGATYQLDKWELLSKMTFLYWDGPPNDRLYAQVAGADLTDPKQLAAVQSAILADPAAQNGIENFYTEWLGLAGTPQLDSMNSASYKTFAQGVNYNAAGHHLRQDMLQEVLDMTAHYTFSGSGTYADLMNSPYSFASSTDLAQLYGLATAWDGTTQGLTPFPAAQPRAGLLTRAAFLITGVEYTDPIIKGKRVRFDLLCDTLPPPPPTVNVVPVQQDAVHTTRYLSEQATAGTPSNPMECMQCHQWMNPLGFVTENYDSLGRFRTVEQKFDPTTGAQDGRVPVTTQVTGYLYAGDNQVLADGVAMDAYIAQTGVGQRCLAQQYFRYAFGRQEVVAQDGCSLEAMRQSTSLLGLFGSTASQQQFQFRQVQ